MGTMLQAADLTLEDFDGHEGCNEVLNVTRPDVVRSVHSAYLAAGADAVETNTFGANWANLAEYGIEGEIERFARAGATLARDAADEFSTEQRPRWVLGSVGPGTKLPSLGHARYAFLRDAYETQVRGMLDGGIDAVLVETSQDLLQTKSAIIGAKRAMDALGQRVPIIAQITVETTGTMLLGTETAAALIALEPLGIDLIGLNCATGPAEMSEHLRTLSQLAKVGISVMPNAGLPVLGPNGALYPLGPEELAEWLTQFVRDYGVGLVGGCCGTTPEHIRVLVEACRDLEVPARTPLDEPSVSSLYQAVTLRQDLAYLAIGERTNANGSKAFREAMLEGRIDDCIDIAKDQTREGAHVLDLCVDYVGRDGAADMSELAFRLATASTLPIVLDSTEPNVLEAGLERLGGRSILNSVNFEDGDGPESRFRRTMALAAEHGAAVIALTIDEQGQARTAEHKVAIATRLIDTLADDYGLRPEDVIVDCLTFTIAAGLEESRRDALETIEAIRQLKLAVPNVQTTLGLSNVSFGLNPAARAVLNSVFLHECVEAGLDSAIVHPSRIMPMSRIDEELRKVALDLIYDRRATDYDPLSKYLELFDGVDVTSTKESRAAELAALPLGERLQRRIIDGEKNGLESDLDAALVDQPALEIINDTLLSGMKTVGELFGSGQMQLPFVLQSAEVMKTAVAYLEPHMEKADSGGKGTIVLATVKGDVHDIGKNLVDIILTNNGYTVVNLGIKQPVSTILDAAVEHDADAIGMSGLLVKSTVIMRENLEELNLRGLAAKFPVLLGGAALTRAYVEHDLSEVYDGNVRYAKDAFEGLHLMDALMATRRGIVPSAATPSDPNPWEAAPRRRRRQIAEVDEPIDNTRSDVATDVAIPEPPFFGTRVIKGVALSEYSSYLDERATFLGQWGLKSTRGDGPSYEELVETEGRPRLRSWLERIQSEQIMEAAVVYGYFPCYSEGNDLVVLHEDGTERERFTFPRQRRDRRLCLADFFAAKDSGKTDVVGFHIATMGNRVSEVTGKLFAENSYREYLELHGLSVQLTEALAEYWHARVRNELGFGSGDSPDLKGILDQGYRGSRYSFGYPACPNLEDHAQLLRLLDPSRIGVELSEEYQLHPEQTTSAIIVHHPEAKYFAAG